MPCVASNEIKSPYDETENVFGPILEYIYETMNRANNEQDLYQILVRIIVDSLETRLVRCDKDEAFIARFIGESMEHVHNILGDILEQLTCDYSWNEIRNLSMADYYEIILF